MIHYMVVSAPSGTDKTSLPKTFLSKQKINNFRLTISHTNRCARAGELNGIDYDFVYRDIVEDMIQKIYICRVCKSFLLTIMKHQNIQLNQW